MLLQLEDYGFCAKGEGGPFASSGAIELGGSLPINTGGGHLSEGYIHGMNHIVEGVRQIRGTSTNQVEGAETCLVTNTPLPPGQRADPAEGRLRWHRPRSAPARRRRPRHRRVLRGRPPRRARRAGLLVVRRRAAPPAGVLPLVRDLGRRVARRRRHAARCTRWTVVDHQVHPAYPVPYTIVLVDLDDAPGVRLVGHLPGSPDLHDGMPMRVRFDEVADGVVLPQWEPAD